MQSKSVNTISSGIEPVDELMGGLERGQLYLVHGDAAGKSLFGIKFLIEGLKQGENCALVIRYSPEDVVRRFARLGYDCLEDVYSGRLVILEYSDDIIQKIGKLRELTPVLRELEWLLGETRPVRLIFDPVASVLAGAEGNLETRVREFAAWARSFGATVVLIANESNQEITKTFEPLVAESFRFDVRDVADQATRFITFGKSLSIPEQAIEVDPTRGVFLIGREDTTPGQPVPQPPSSAELESIREELRAARFRPNLDAPNATTYLEFTGEAPLDLVLDPDDTTPLGSDSDAGGNDQTTGPTPVDEKFFQIPLARMTSKTASSQQKNEPEFPIEPAIASSDKQPPRFEGQLDELSYLLDDLTGSASPLDLELPELDFLEIDERISDRPDSTHSREPAVRTAPEQSPSSGEVRETHIERENLGSPGRRRATDTRIESTVAARAAEVLLHAPEADADSTAEFGLSQGQAAERRRVREVPQHEPIQEPEIRPSDFNIMIIEDDLETCDRVMQTLTEYSLEVVQDGVSGLAKLISFKPDLVILDFDLPVIDGFKVLTLIRSALNVPIIILSGSRIRAIDRVMASELGADYYLTKPFSAKELKHKARQLIARYRGLSSWITNPSGTSSATPPAGSVEHSVSAELDENLFIPYTEFALEVDKRVKLAMDSGGAPFSIVGCRLPQITAGGGRTALKLFDIVRGLARDSDLTSTNPQNDLVVLLADAGVSGARSFASRLGARVKVELNQEPALWMRSFPDFEESADAATANRTLAHSVTLNRRSGDQSIQPNEHAR